MANARPDHAERTARLKAGRARDSAEKRERAVQVCAQLIAMGTLVTHASVARAASVSPWLTYNAPDVRIAIEQAKEKQRHEGLADPPARITGPRTTPVSLQTDLLSARAEIKQLREDLKRLRTRLSSKLGQEVEGVSAAELLERVREVEEANRKLSQGLAERERDAVKLADRVKELEEENEAKTQQLRSMIFAQNT